MAFCGLAEGAKKRSRQEIIIMAEESQWKHKYGILKDYITSNPEIYIDQHEVCIPEDLRGRFINISITSEGQLLNHGAAPFI